MMQKSDFNSAFEHMYSNCNQNEFEAWFRAMMECIHKGDFEFIKSGGRHGDKKSDGRIISGETVFQCYAPESPATFAKYAPGKIKDSFPQVLNYWPNLKAWVFVHNNAGGIGTSASDVLEGLRAEYHPVKIQTRSRQLLKELHDNLTMQQLIDIYPGVRLDFGNVQMDTIRPLLRKVKAEHVAPTDPLYFGEDPDPKKLEINKLSSEARFNIQRARKGVGIVDRYIDGLSKPTSASIIQSSLISQYKNYMDLEHTPDEILAKLLKFVGDDGTPTITAAAYVIITYYFDACDIFKNVPKAVKTC